MAGNGDNQNPDNLPIVLLHRLPRFGITFKSWLRNRFFPIDPIDPSDQSVLAMARSARVLFCVGPTPVTSQTLDDYPSVELVAGSSAGIDHVDLAECRRRGIRVTNAGDAFSEDVADYAIGLLMDVLCRISAAGRYVRAGLWPLNGEFPLGSKLSGKRVGIVGLGSIGLKIASRLEAFRCIISYNSKTKKPHLNYLYYENVLDLAKNNDILIICCALTEETHHMINKTVLTALGKTGVVVNVGRGGLVDEKELVRFLSEGQIGGAGLDVFENEPRVPEELFKLDNIVLSAHRAVLTPESFAALQELVVANVEAFFENRPLLSEVKLS